MADDDTTALSTSALTNGLGKYTKEEIPISTRKTKEEIRNELAIILAQIADCKLRGVAPPFGLIGEAFALASLYPYGDILDKLLEITKLALEATKAAVENGSFPADSWLASDERKAFDELVARDPMQAARKYFNNKRIIEDMENLSDLLSGKNLSHEKMISLTNNILSEEDQYKIAAMTPGVAVKAEMAKQQGNAERAKEADGHLAGFAKRTIYKEVFLERQGIHKAAGKAHDCETIIQKDGHLIAGEFKTVADNIKQNIPGGLSALGAACAHFPDLVKELLRTGNIEQTARQVETAANINIATADLEIQRKAEEAAMEFTRKMTAASSAEKQKQAALAEAIERKRVADEKAAAEQKRIADAAIEAERKRQADAVEQKKIADAAIEAERKRQADAVEQKKIADAAAEAERKRLEEAAKISEETKTMAKQETAEIKVATLGVNVSEEKQKQSSETTNAKLLARKAKKLAEQAVKDTSIRNSLRGLSTDAPTSPPPNYRSNNDHTPDR